MKEANIFVKGTQGVSRPSGGTHPPDVLAGTLARQGLALMGRTDNG